MPELIANPVRPSSAAGATPAVAGFGTGADPEFSFSDADFQRVRELIYQRAGISLNAGKQAMVYSRLSRRLRETHQRSFANYLQWLPPQAAAPSTRSSVFWTPTFSACVS